MQQLAPPPRPAGDAHKLLEDVLGYIGILKRGWKFIAISLLVALTAAVIYLARSKTVYRTSARLLVIQQGGRNFQVGGGNDSFQGMQGASDSLVTHLMIIRSPIIVERAIALSGVKTVSVPSVIENLTAKLPNESARIIEVSFKAGLRDEAVRVMDGVIQSYDRFLKDNYQKNTNEVISLIIRARDELNGELKSLEKEYLEYRQNSPLHSADDTGRTFIARRLDQWDQSMNQVLARSLQLKTQLVLGRKLASEGADTTAITNALNQLGGLGASAQPAPMTATATTANDPSASRLVKDLAELESERRTAEKLLAHLQKEQADSSSNQVFSEQELEQAFLADPDVADVQDNLRDNQAKLRSAVRLSRSPREPAVVRCQRQILQLQDELKRLWTQKKPIIAQSLARESNLEITTAVRLTKADLVNLKARESAFREQLDEVVTEQLDELRLEHKLLGQVDGENQQQIRQLAQQIAQLESIKGRKSNRRSADGNSKALLDSIAQSLEAIEVMRSDLQGKFDEDSVASQKTQLSQLEEANLRNNMDRQRTLFHSVVAQLKAAQLSSDFGSVSTQLINPVAVAAERASFTSVIALAIAAGCGLGTLAAFVVDILDSRVHTLSEIRRLVDLPVIGLIPQLSFEQIQVTGAVGLLSHEKPRSEFAECYKSTRTNFESIRRVRQSQVLLITSAYSGDGKSTTASNLAITLAHAGRHVLLVDADLRKPSLDAIFGLPSEHGLSDALERDIPIGQLVQPTLVTNLDLLTSGPEVNHPAELLASYRLVEILSEMRRSYDTVIIDSSPLLAVTDPAIIAAAVDGIILVVRLASVRRHDIERMMDSLKTQGTPIIGTVVNGVKTDQVGYAYGYGGYGYGRSYAPRKESGNATLKATPHTTKNLPSMNGRPSLADAPSESVNAE